MMDERIPYKNYRTRPPYWVSVSDRYNANEIEVQVARGIVRYLERAENADKKAMLVDSARHEKAIAQRFGYGSPQHNEATLKHIRACIALKDIMASEWMHPQDEAGLFDVALTRVIRFYVEGTFFDTHEREPS